MKYLAHYAANNDYEEFPTFEEAEKWLQERYSEDAAEGYAVETTESQDFIAVITHRSEYVETANRKDYKWNEEASGYFIDGDPDQDEWPISDDFESVGEIVLKEQPK